MAGHNFFTFSILDSFTKIQANDDGQSVYALADGKLFKSIDGGQNFEQQVFKMKGPMVRKGGIRSFTNYSSLGENDSKGDYDYDDGKVDQ